MNAKKPASPPRQPKVSRPKSRKMRIGDRQIEAVGQADGIWFDLYHQAMTISFPAFVGATLAVFMVNNLFFALLYWLGNDPLANAPTNSFQSAFFFAVETFTTVGYGDMHPQTFYAHVIATFEGFTALFQTAALTGLIFARFSRPRARILFADAPVVANHDGEPTLMIRLANARQNAITDANAVLWVLRTEWSAEGQRFRRFHRLPLSRQENPTFLLSWTLFHPLNEASPLYGLTPQAMIDDNVQLILTVKGMDETSAQELRARKIYQAADIRWGHRYVDIITTTPEGVTLLDYGKFHTTVADKA